MRYGMKALSSRELLAIVIRSGNAHQSALEIADEILRRTEGIGNLTSLTLNDLTSIKGLQKAKGLELLACFEIARRMSFEQCLKKDVISDPDSLVKWLQLELGSCTQEMFLAVYLDVRNQIIHHEVLFKGTLDRSLVHPREVFKQALLISSSRLIVVHNHPSGNPEPSAEDILLTDQLQEIGHLMKIELLDHLIVAKARAFSFKQAGLLD